MPAHETLPRHFVSADWSKHPSKRSIHVTDLQERRIRHFDRADWTFCSLIHFARGLTSTGPVLVGIDVAFGVPAGLKRQAHAARRWPPGGTFVDWLRSAARRADFFETVEEPEQWRDDRPFFHVPGREGGLRSMAERLDGGMLRCIDSATGAKPLFAVSGIPGTVGSGTREVWRELAPLLTDQRDFAIWPFEGGLAPLLRSSRLVVAETYPGLAYAAALEPELPTHRVTLAKTKHHAREQACDQLGDASWVRRAGVDLGDLGAARQDEDAFDSHLTAAAVLRCAVEGRPLADTDWIESVVEGGMLLAGAVDLDRRPRRFGRPRPGPATKAHPRHPRRTPSDAHKAPLVCPIPGCDKEFRFGRGGWDGHVGSHRMHPWWHPDVEDPEERRRLFRLEFPAWLR